MKGKSSRKARKQVMLALLQRQLGCHGEEWAGKHFRDTSFGSGQSWTQEKNNCFPLRPPKGLKSSFSSLRSETGLLRMADVRANCRAWESFQWTLRSPSLLGEGAICLEIIFQSLAVCSYPSVPSNYNCKSNNSFKCQNNICFVKSMTEK